MKETPLFGLLAVLALFASFPFDAALARITEDHEEIREPDDPADLTAVRVAGPFEFPWSIAFLSDGAMLVTERPGRLRVIRNGILDPRPVAGVPAVSTEGARGLQGLMDVVLHPNFNENHWVYLTYHKPVGQASGVTTLALARKFFSSFLHGGTKRPQGWHIMSMRGGIFNRRAWFGSDITACAVIPMQSAVKIRHKSVSFRFRG